MAEYLTCYTYYYYYYYGITGQTAVADKAPKLQITTNYNEKQCM